MSAPSNTMRGDWRAHGTPTVTNTTLVTVAEDNTIVFIFADIATLSVDITSVEGKTPMRIHGHCIQIDAYRTVAMQTPSATLEGQSHNNMMLEIGAIPGHSPYRAGIQVHEERDGKVFHPLGIFWPGPLAFALWSAFMLKHANVSPLFFGMLNLR